MTNETQKLLDELKAIRLELFRSSAGLDLAIRSIETDIMAMDEKASPEYVRTLIASEKEYRATMATIQGWDKLVEREKEIWMKLIESI